MPHAASSPTMTGLWQRTKTSGTVFPVPLAWSAVRSVSLVMKFACPTSTPTRLASVTLPSCAARLTAMFHELSAWALAAKRSGGAVGP